MGFGKTAKEARYRLAIKRILKVKGVKGWRKNSPTKKLEFNLRKAIKKRR